MLNDAPVPGITAFLTAPGATLGTPYRLAANGGKSYQGTIVLGIGFVLDPEHANGLIDNDQRNRDVLFPYLSGEDLNSRPDQSPSRWVINFRDWPLDRKSAPKGYEGPVAADYPLALSIVRERVKPERDRNNRKVYRDRWWQFGEKRPELYSTVGRMTRVLAIPETTKYCTFSFCSTNMVFSHMVKVIVLEEMAYFALLASSIHEVWARSYSSTLETRLKYITSDAFETFPFTERMAELQDVGSRYYFHRRGIMLERQEGITKLYNRVHNPDERSHDIAILRHLHTEVDSVVARAYGWADLDLEHGLHHTSQGVRFTISDASRRRVLDRLLNLNHKRHSNEAETLGVVKKGVKGLEKASMTSEPSIQSRLLPD